MSGAGWSLSPKLRLALTGLVASNLAFVAITGEVGWVWLMPLILLTMIGPLLPKLQELLSWRIAWNALVCVLFVLLVHDATRSGVRFMLRDGLILAAFCQVHLLNNLGRGQKPELLFFNSFLIALVTCFFSQDLEFLFAFVLWAPLQILSMSLYALGNVPPGSLGLVFRRTATQTLVLLAATALCFVALPRDFEREGLVGRYLEQAGEDSIGFSEMVELGRTTTPSDDSRIVLVVERLRGEGRPPRYWRGATFGRWLGREWQVYKSHVQRRGRGERGWRFVAPGRWESSRRGTSRWQVKVTDRRAPRLFAPLTATSLELRPPSDPMHATLLRDGTLRYVRVEDEGDPRYEIDVGDETREAKGRRRATRKTLWHGRFSATSRPASRLAQSIARTDKEEQHVTVERLRHWLATRREYALPGTDGAARDLVGFLRGASGHCEYFATALVLMLRSKGIPCRLVTGFAGGEWNEAAGRLTMRSRHAHAWVEVLDPTIGWYLVDATPSSGQPTAVEESAVTSFKRWLEGVWASITGLDADARARWVAWLQALPSRAGNAVLSHPFSVGGGVFALLALWWGLRRRRRERRPEAIVDYERCLGELGLTRAAHETPRTLLARAQHEHGIDSEALAKLERVTEQHEAARYAGVT